ncbi:MAG: flavodoxin family protein [Acholeplasmatales bacterium]|nr:flavodoxin family protein [Acholeplasmatales bacterium]
MWDNLEKLNILVLNGSPKMNNSSTMKVTNAFLEGIKNKRDCNIELINIQALNIKPCIGCLSCWGKTEGECIIKDDDISIVKQKLLKADIIIESFPLFFFGMPGIVKLFTDRLLSMMNTYRGDNNKDTERSLHGLRYDDPNKRFVLISTCAYTDVSLVYESLIKQYDFICGKDSYSKILVPQMKTLVDVNNKNKLDKYLNKFILAGEEFVSNGTLSKECEANLSKPPFSEGAYKIFLDQFWKEEKESK